MSNPFNKKIRKEMKNLQVGESTFFPWAAISAGGLSGRPEQPAFCGFGGKVFYMEPTDAGLKVTRHEDASLDQIKGAVGL